MHLVVVVGVVVVVVVVVGVVVGGGGGAPCKTEIRRQQPLQQAVVDNSALDFPDLPGFQNGGGNSNCVPAPGFCNLEGVR